MKTNFVVVENKTKFKLWIYYKWVRGDYMHIAVTIDPVQAPTLAKHEKYLLSPNRMATIPLKKWSTFQGIKFDAKRVRDVWLSADELRRPSEGSHHVLIRAQPN